MKLPGLAVEDCVREPTCRSVSIVVMEMVISPMLSVESEFIVRGRWTP
jgi:hypothetical protein